MSNRAVVTFAKAGPEFRTFFHEKRKAAANSILEFNFIADRVRCVSECKEISKNNAGGVLYWMNRDQRVQDNWAMLYAQKLALENGDSPLSVCFTLPKSENTLSYNRRHYSFLIDGLMEVEKELAQLNINFYLLTDKVLEDMQKVCITNKISALVVDFGAMPQQRRWLNDVVKSIGSKLPIFQVDAHNLVPCWKISDKQEFAARTIRIKFLRCMISYLTEYPPVISQNSKHFQKSTPISWDNIKKHFVYSKDRQSDPEVIVWAKGGYERGLCMLEFFCQKRLRKYAENRNNPCKDGLSKLSPWFHFGHLSCQRALLRVRDFRVQHADSVSTFTEETLVRRELSDNFCNYSGLTENVHPMNFIPAWCKTTLSQHVKDKREYSLSLEEFETAQSHDPLWNASQIQLVTEGKLHGYLRMYWAKKILEWTDTPHQAYEFSILLNDKYSLDGSDPNGIVGCLWSVGGLHDRPWAERPIFGKIRTMTYKGCEGKFDVKKFIARYCNS